VRIYVHGTADDIRPVAARPTRHLIHRLDGLRCSACLTENTLWLDHVRALVECRECGQTALIVPAADEGRTA